MSDSLGSKIVSYARAQVGKKVHNGECFYLADYALKDAGAKSASDFGEVNADTDYVWGTSVGVDKTQAGDVIQFRNYKSEVAVDDAITIAFPDACKSPVASLEYFEGRTDTIEYDHHTAVAENAISQGSVSVLEQNVDRNGNGVKEKIVRAREIVLKSRPQKSSRSTRRITINRAWGERIKKYYKTPSEKKLIDEIVKSCNNRTVDAKVATTSKTTVTGRIWVYRAQKR